ncbi:CDP-glucose 4,6-dehydratase [Castellaniella sp.]|uniref:CDP-glucose 4,6-dehydratase n=1 Tax=Castellaniella sp. TaxID=1955812 RepID=UPI002AFED728|nr:CDP-glucose 4,6-dehydratase [Castellaniella sp.]
MENMVTKNDFWRGRRVFITGHTGFKGSWLSLWLRKLGAHVTGLALPAPTSPSLFDLARVSQGMDSTLGDIRDPEIVRSAIARAQPEIVIHMAAQPLVRRSYQAPAETYAINVLGTVHVLDAIRHCPSVRAAINVTTDKCYENHEWPWPYRENDMLGGHDPYSASKACSELVTASYRRAFLEQPDPEHHTVALASARAGNVIGGGDWAPDRLIPDLVRARDSRQPLHIRRPNAIRPWQHVLEPLCGYLMLAEHLLDPDAKCAQAFNFGPTVHDARTVGWVTERLSRSWHVPVHYDEGCEGPHEAGLLQLDASKARHLLGWQPRLTIDTALDLTCDWFERLWSGSSAESLVLDQIEFYESLCPARSPRIASGSL